MEFWALAVLLAIMQASPPVPRKAANPSNGTSQNVKTEPSGNKGPSQQPPPLVQPVSAQPDQRDGYGPAANNTQKPVTVRELPPVSVTKDWLDKLYILFTGGLMLVGGLGVRAAYRSLKGIQQQVAEMKAQREAMQGQLTTMQSQLTEMGKQTETLGKSVEVSGISANAARDNVEMFVSKERARLRVEVLPLKFLKGRERAAGLPDTVKYQVCFHGPTEAFIAESAHYAHVSHSRDPILSQSLIGTLFPMDIPQVIGPSTPLPEKFQFIYPNLTLSEETVQLIIKGEMFVHFYGFIKYRDVFDRERITEFCYSWNPGSLLPKIDNLPHWERWEQSGPPERNRST